MNSNIIIRKAVPEDAEQLIECLKIVGGETENLTFGSEGMPVSVRETGLTFCPGRPVYVYFRFFRYCCGLHPLIFLNTFE